MNYTQRYDNFDNFDSKCKCNQCEKREYYFKVVQQTCVYPVECYHDDKKKDYKDFDDNKYYFDNKNYDNDNKYYFDNNRHDKYDNNNWNSNYDDKCNKNHEKNDNENKKDCRHQNRCCCPCNWFRCCR